MNTIYKLLLEKSAENNNKYSLEADEDDDTETDDMEGSDDDGEESEEDDMSDMDKGTHLDEDGESSDEDGDMSDMEGSDEDYGDSEDGDMGDDSEDDYSDDEDGGDFGDSDEDESNKTIDPNDLKIMNLSEKEALIHNIKLVENCRILINSINDTINNINNIHSDNEMHTKIGKTVVNNLYDLSKDVNNFVSYRLSDSYETNVMKFMSFTSRFKIAVELFKTSHDTYIK